LWYLKVVRPPEGHDIEAKFFLRDRPHLARQQVYPEMVGFDELGETRTRPKVCATSPEALPRLRETRGGVRPVPDSDASATRSAVSPPTACRENRPSRRRRKCCPWPGAGRRRAARAARGDPRNNARFVTRVRKVHPDEARSLTGLNVPGEFFAVSFLIMADCTASDAVLTCR
jgi:hypothetical protein